MHATSKKKIIAAVSGGVDSVVMLSMLLGGELEGFDSPNPNDVIIAHVNHGIRQTAKRDQVFVQKLAETFGCRFETITLSLGPDASEERARDARYDFFNHLASKYRTTSVLIAHHAHDVVETAILNLLRGTGRSGLSSLKTRDGRIRPLLHMTKKEILVYAQKHNLAWVEDETNADPKYLRNAVRSRLADKYDSGDYAQFSEALQKISQLNQVVDQHVDVIVRYKLHGSSVIARKWFVKLDHTVACEVMRAVLVKLEVRDINKSLIERLVIALKAARPGTKHDIDGNLVAYITKRSMRIVNRTTLKSLRW